MKQGRASHSGMGGTKIEPRSHGVNPAYPAILGSMKGNHSMEGDTPRTEVVPMTQGRGLKAPMAKETQHHCGSQGRHK